MKIQLSDHFTYSRLLRFTLPSVLMMVFVSIYGIVDGFFISNFAGKTAFAGANFVLPYLMLLSCSGFIFGAGGGALTAKTLGEQHSREASRIFSMFVWLSVLVGLVLLAVGMLTARSFAAAFGATGQMLEDAERYALIVLVPLPLSILQYAFQNFFVTAGKPQLGLYVILLAGGTNIVLDLVFVGVFGWGLEGAAWATVISESIAGGVPILYFVRPNSSSLRLVPVRLAARPIWQGISNGFSELLTSISGPLLSTVFNAQLLRFAGENGVAAYGVLMYANLVFVGTFLGFSTGVTSIVGYNYGAGNRAELKSIRRKCLLLITVFAAVMAVCSELFGRDIAVLFVGYDQELLNVTEHGFEIFSISFLFAGYPVLISAFFTGLNNGLLSAAVSASRILLFQLPCVLILPMLFGVDGIWWSVVLAELLAGLVGLALLRANRGRYGY
ncbi:MAG: MATE family efflux transporter [Clostridia bacterium]|nr:MATE family efflux transporter [Clostridia bacterium]